MSVKKSVSDSDTTKTVAETENAVVNTETEAATAPAAVTPPVQKSLYDGITTFAYVGPSLPSGWLKSNTILNGTYAEITEYYKEAIELFPSVARLFVPVSRLAESREKLLRGGNLISRHFQEVAAAIAKMEKEKGENE